MECPYLKTAGFDYALITEHPPCQHFTKMTLERISERESIKYYVGQKILLDGKLGLVKSVHPEGRGLYAGVRNSHMWVLQPVPGHGHPMENSHEQQGKAVLFRDCPRRVKTIKQRKK